MESSLQKALQQLGLNQKEIKFYLTSFKLGPATVGEIAKVARLERSTAYLIAPVLMEHGLLEEDYHSYGKRVYAVEPKKLMSLLAAKQRVLRRSELEIEENLADLQALYQASEVLPKVKVYEGNSGLLTIWQDILSAKSEIMLWTNQETETSFFNQSSHNKFITERVKKKIPIRVLAVNNSKGSALLKDDTATLRQTRLLPEGVTFSAETYLYDNKIASLDYKKDIIGVIIQSEPIVNVQKAIFEMNWKSLGTI